ncbi:MAG: hypothetical protein A2167_05765 [Planctomycetes bacterium RBG_13_46_10]|nr:MAG: hypothetical protein A2167_05765 [Planctomycetes bacterium RBG_13_46_10]
MAYPEFILKSENGARFRTLLSFVCQRCLNYVNPHCSTIVENVRQIDVPSTSLGTSFLQIFRPGSRRDKANLIKAKINLSSYLTDE